MNAVNCSTCATCSDSPVSDDPDSAAAPLRPVTGEGVDLSNDSLASKLLYYQRLGYQADVSLESLHEFVDGVPNWNESLPPVCGHDPSSVTSDEEQIRVSQLSRDQLRLLWHQRLGHLHDRRLHDTHKSADGIPRLPVGGTALDRCPVCIQAKLRKDNRGTENSRRATCCGQGISVDFGFMVQPSKNTKRLDRLRGLNGETCYCLIADHHSGTLWGQVLRSKAPPLDFLNRWLVTHSPGSDVADKYVRFDLGGELGNCNAVTALFEGAGYKIEPTAADSSHMNGPGERPHQSIANALRTILLGANLAPKFWPYAFHHYIRLYNMTTHGLSTKSPFEICTGKRPNLRLLRTFGCRVYALPARPKRPDKLLSDACSGIFLGFGKTMKNVLYFDNRRNMSRMPNTLALMRRCTILVTSLPMLSCFRVPG